MMAPACVFHGQCAYIRVRGNKQTSNICLVFYTFQLDSSVRVRKYIYVVFRDHTFLIETDIVLDFSSVNQFRILMRDMSFINLIYVSDKCRFDSVVGKWQKMYVDEMCTVFIDLTFSTVDKLIHHQMAIDFLLTMANSWGRHHFENKTNRYCFTRYV